MITVAYVKIWGELIGAVAWDEDRQLASFEYDSDFISKGWDIAPLKMPLSNGKLIYTFPQLRAGRDAVYDTFKGLPGLLADVLPDKYGNQLIDSWLAQQGRPSGSMNPVEKLCFIGTRGMGAITFEPARVQERQEAYSIELDALVDITKKMLTERAQFATSVSQEEHRAIQDIIRIGTSAGGARPKAVIAYRPSTGEVRSGQADAPPGFEHYLIKLDGVDDTNLGVSSGYGRIEMAYHLMAKDCGIHMMDCTLLEEHGRAHFMTKRYDREGGHIRHHVQTWCAMSHYDFNDMSSYSYELLFETMRALRLDYQDAEELFRRMAFNIIARNCDDHTKNFSFIMKQGAPWKLAPAYDLCYSYDPNSIWVNQHALSVNGKRRDQNRDDLLRVARSMNIKKASTIIDQVSSVVANWNRYADEVGVDRQKKDMISEQHRLM